MRFICLIPARKNSKRLKNKNFINLKGKPLVELTLNLSNKIKFFNQIVLSTDNKKLTLRLLAGSGCESILD